MRNSNIFEIQNILLQRHFCVKKSEKKLSLQEYDVVCPNV